MRRINSFGTLLSLGLGLSILGCTDDVTAVPADTGTGSETATGTETATETGDGDGDSGDGDGDGDGDWGDGDGDDDPCPEGTHGCPCGPGDFCEEPLVCNDGVCEDDEPDPVCGNGLIEEGEECDDGMANANEAACKLDCTAQVCGDGHVHAGVEACDDGNMDDTDACTNACGLPGCGDGILQMGEACDDGNLVDTDACLSSCIAASCGDLFVYEGMEACDDGNDIDTDACLPGCIAASCGDTFVYEGVEACDDGNVADLDGCNSNCQVTGSVIWEATYSGGANSCDYFYGVDVAPNGRIAVIGQLGKVVDPLGDCRIIVRVYEDDGTLVWSGIPTTGPHCDEGWGVDWDAQNTLWVAGTVYDQNNLRQQWVRRYDAVFNSMWSRTFGDVMQDYGYGIAVDSDGRGILVGTHQFMGTGYDVSVRAIAANGSTVWSREINQGANDFALDVMTAGDDIFVAGFLEYVGQNQNVWAGKFDLAGNTVWNYVYNGQFNGLDRAGGISRGPDGTLAIAGFQQGQTNHDILTQKLDANGGMVWSQTYNNPQLLWADRAQEVGVDSEGNVVTVGLHWDPGMMVNNFDGWMRKYNPDGTEIWSDYATGPVDGEDAWFGVEIADNDEILVVGGMTTDLANCTDAVLRRYAR
jgi:cysteine-rich repeat protein